MVGDKAGVVPRTPDEARAAPRQPRQPDEVDARLRRDPAPMRGAALLVERVDVSPDGADIRLRTEGLTNLVADLRAVRPDVRRAA